jgi:pyruvate dehydrogenase E2 component (dihydrolipoamide acetyltransferase)
MAEIIRMPKMSDTMTEGVIAKWLKKVGDKVKSGDVLAEVETDKATMELESYQDGVLLHIGVAEKQAVAIDGLLAIIGKAGENIEALLANSQSNNPSAVAAPKVETTAKQEVHIPVVSPAVAPANVKATVIRMPKMSDTMTEGVIAKWLKKVGDKVKSGDILAEVETDKATMELDNYEDGTLLYLSVEAGKAVVVDGIIAIIGEPDADYKQLLNAPTKTQVAVNQPVSQPTIQEVKPTTQAPSTTQTDHTQTGRIKASPLAKSLAKAKGLDLKNIAGTGEAGRIVKKDIETYQTQPESSKNTTAAVASSPQKDSYTEVAVSQMRKVIARRLSESLFTAPHFFLTMEINMDKAMTARASMNEISAVKLSFNDLVIKACAVALKKHPAVNSSWLGDKIRYNHQVNIGVAVAVEDGLLVPVVRQADSKTLSQIAAEVKDLGTRAKAKKLQPSEWEGNTFSISNLGMFGIEEFTAIINPPDSCILAVGAIKETAIVKNGQLAVGNVMKVTLSCDHRVVDGATGAAFLQTLKALLEEPVRILV